ncbi:hypothetical protein WJ84_01425 [Burkholderia ubonensis]|nr:hypothetical protein WJ84_01425 [Burkholderia ubonensis]KVP39915.1 hypothetical protein WJ87_06945 [Burkholderia ubonensis]
MDSQLEAGPLQRVVFLREFVTVLECDTHICVRRSVLTGAGAANDARQDTDQLLCAVFVNFHVEVLQPAIHGLAHTAMVANFLQSSDVRLDYRCEVDFRLLFTVVLSLHDISSRIFDNTAKWLHSV